MNLKLIKELFYNLKHAKDFYVFVARKFPLVYLVLFLTIVTLILEYSVTSLMVPLASTEASLGMIGELWNGVANWLHLGPSPQLWLWLFLLFLSLRLIFGFLQATMTNHLGREVHRYLSEKVFGRIVSSEPITEVYKRSVGFYITIGGDDTFKCGTIVITTIQCFSASATALIGMVVLYLFSKLVFWSMIGFLAFCGVIVLFIFGIIWKTNVRANSLSRELNTAYIEALNSLRSIRVLGAQVFVQSSYAKQITGYVRMLTELEAFRGLIRGIPALALLFCGIFVMWPWRETEKMFSVSSVFATTVILLRVFMALGQIVSSLSHLVGDLRAAKDINGFLGKSEIANSADIYSSDQSLRNISLKNISFGYTPQFPILKNIDINFEEGKTYAIVGPSGSGKSTLGDLILGLIQPDTGEVLLNGENKRYGLESRRMMLVEQQVRIFSTSIRENILVGTKRSDQELWRVLDAVGLGDLVRSYDHQLDTVLSYQGSNLSGGQRQRLGVARALLDNPDVLILDEATSALDSETKSAVIENIKAGMSKGILIFITHEESVAANADVVIRIVNSQVFKS